MFVLPVCVVFLPFIWDIYRPKNNKLCLIVGWLPAITCRGTIHRAVNGISQNFLLKLRYSLLIINWPFRYLCKQKWPLLISFAYKPLLLLLVYYRTHLRFSMYFRWLDHVFKHSFLVFLNFSTKVLGEGEGILRTL